ncbi:hypothetical protein P7K49_024743 [Saguinus oedipus]|uniref:Uncharacterized protein n=1 Tax=Saguinus oedipus TaxID=9490 RepID=A0ABQ9USN7_SAGOE|nr:hypothetical protein P7K49_024743 [Saguinus oedipus]
MCALGETAASTVPANTMQDVPVSTESASPAALHHHRGASKTTASASCGGSRALAGQKHFHRPLGPHSNDAGPGEVTTLPRKSPREQLKLSSAGRCQCGRKLPEASSRALHTSDVSTTDTPMSLESHCCLTLLQGMERNRGYGQRPLCTCAPPKAPAFLSAPLSACRVRAVAPVGCTAEFAVARLTGPADEAQL